MQTFLPYPDFKKSLGCLDWKRCGKQRVEAEQILRIILGLPKKNGEPYQRWLNHAAVRMWRGYSNALTLYYNLSLHEWVNRGYVNNMKTYPIDGDIVFPPWFGNERFHASHRSNLIRKNSDFYSRYGWVEPPNLPYYWPA